MVLQSICVPKFATNRGTMLKFLCLIGILFYKFASAQIGLTCPPDLRFDYPEYTLGNLLADGNTNEEFIMLEEEIPQNTNDIPELKYLDKSVDPCDNFYKFTCGNFKEVHPLPDGAKYIDEFSILQEHIHRKAKEILEIPITKNNSVALKKAKAFYKSCLDVGYTDRMDSPYLGIQDTLGQWPVISTRDTNKPTWPRIGDYIAEYGLPFYFDFQIVPSNNEADSNIIYLTMDGLSNPEAGIFARVSEDFDFLAPAPSSSERDTEEDTPYFNFLKNMAMELKRITQSFKQEWQIVQEIRASIKYLELVRDGGHKPTEEISILPREATVAELQDWTNTYFGEEIQLNWIEFLNHAFKYSGAKVTKDTKVMQSNIKLLWGMLELYRRSEGDDILNYIFARLLIFTAPDGNAFMRNALKEFYEVLERPVLERSEYCLRKTLGYPGGIDFSFAVTAEYVEHFWDINKISTAGKLETTMEYGFIRAIESLSWMVKEDIDKATRKVDKMRVLLAFPKEMITKKEILDEYYENLRVCTWDHYGNSRRLRAFNRAKNFMEIANSRNRSLWSVSPLVVNAFYNRPNNRITLPVSILNPVFFENVNSSLLNYARIGAIIGHEITHSVDNSGRRYDEQGQLANWWSKETEENFLERTKCFEEQYNKYFIEEIGANVNGSTTLNENLADNGGLKLAYDEWVYRNNPDNPETIASEEFTKEQLFFIAYGTMWCGLETDEYLRSLHKASTYSPNRYRVIGAVSNMKEFSDAFNCPKNSNMNPEKKCTLW